MMLRYPKLLWLFATLSIQSDVAYRFDFLTHALFAFLQLGGELIGLWTIFSKTKSLGGWNVYQVVVLLGVFRIMTGVIALFIAPNMRLIMEDVREGTLDFVLIKPLNAQFYASVRRIVIWRIMDVLIGVLMVIVGSSMLAEQVTAWRVALFVPMLASGIAIIYSVWLALATLAFWFTRINNLEMVFWNVFEAGRYPVDIYGRWIRMALTYVIPLAFLTTIPAASLVKDTNPSRIVTAVAVALVCLALSSAFFRYGVRNYSGASA